MAVEINESIVVELTDDEVALIITEYLKEKGYVIDNVEFKIENRGDDRMNSIFHKFSKALCRGKRIAY